MRRKTKWQIAIVVGVFAALVVLWLALPVGQWLDELVRWVRGKGVVGVLAFSVTTIVLTLTLLPTIELYIGAGLVYGTFWGTTLMTVLTLIAGLLGYWLGRSGLRTHIERQIEKHEGVAALDDAIDERSFWIAFLLRLAPVVPFGMLNYGLAATKIRLWPYIVTLLLGMVPGNLAFAYIGSLLHGMSELSRGPDGVWKHIMLWTGIAATTGASILIGQAAKRALDRAEHSAQAT